MATYTNQFVVYDGGSIKKTASGDTLSHTGNLTVTGDLTVTGNSTTTTISTTNTVVSDKLFELGNGVTGAPSGDAGIIIERGDSDNAIIAWDESADVFVLGTTTATGASTGDLTITAGGLSISALTLGGTTLDSDIATLSVPANTTISAFGATLVDDADASTARTTLGLAIGTDVQAYDAELAAIAGLTSAADKIIRFTGSETAGLLDFVDEDNMASDSATAIPSQQSVKAYVDSATSNIASSSLTFTNNTGNAIAAGSVVGLDSTAGQIVLGSTTVHPVGVATAQIANSSSGSVLSTWGQRVDVKLASSVSTSPGSIVYLVASGEVSTTAPTSGYVYRLGFATETATQSGDGVAEIIWMPQFIADLG